MKTKDEIQAKIVECDTAKMVADAMGDTKLSTFCEGRADILKWVLGESDSQEP